MSALCTQPEEVPSLIRSMEVRTSTPDRRRNAAVEQNLFWAVTDYR
jgi:hypothetical protein